MSIDLQGSRFYMQQMSASRGGTAKVSARLKKDIVADIECILKIKLTSLMNITKPDLETIYELLKIY